MDRFLIAPLDEGQRTDVKPWLIADNAFAQLTNAYIFRGRIKKRFGSRVMNTTVDESVQQLYTRLNVGITATVPFNVGTTDGAGDATATIAWPTFKLGQTLTVGAQLYTVNSILPGPQAMIATSGAATFNVLTGTYVITGCTAHNTAIIFNPFASATTDGAGDATGTAPGNHFAVGQLIVAGLDIFTVISDVAGMQDMLATNGTAKFNITNGVFKILGATHNANLYFYPAEPVMGLLTYQNGQANDNPTIAFDTQFAYQFNGSTWVRAGLGIWTGTDLQFFWSTTWQGDTAYSNLMFVVNYNQPDQIKYWNGATWLTIHPEVNAAGNTLETAQIIITFKDRLVALNTIEFDGAYRTHCNRARWCENGSPLDAGGGPTIVAWREDIPGRGGWSDAPTREEIITAQILRDRLIVYFDSSTWELVYTGNEVLPFRWQQINTELGAQATFSQVPFDKVVLAIGNVGIHACNGNQVERIDDKNPGLVWSINADVDGRQRVYGVRDYSQEMVYWTYPDTDNYTFDTYKYPNKVLVYNYKNSTWATNEDVITAFGYFEQGDSITWEQQDTPWNEMDNTWNSADFQKHAKTILAGNQQGFVYIIDTFDAGKAENAPAMSITNFDGVNSIITSIDHTLTGEDFVMIENCQGVDFATFNDFIFKVFPVDKDRFLIYHDPVATVYTGGGTLRRVSRMEIITKQYNFYIKEGRNTFISKVDFLVDKEGLSKVGADAQVTVECYTSYSGIPLVEDGLATGTLIGTSVLDLCPYVASAGPPKVLVIPFEMAQSELWHTVYFQGDGQAVQLRIYLTDEQMLDPQISLAYFTLNAFMIYAQATSSRLQSC